MIAQVSLHRGQKDVVAQVAQHDGQEKGEITREKAGGKRAGQEDTHADQHAHFAPALVCDWSEKRTNALVTMEAANASEIMPISTFSPAANTARKG